MSSDKTGNKKIVSIIQARMGSSRLPGKVMVDIEGVPMLAHIINRVKHIKRVDDIIVATTTLQEDKQILKLAYEMGVGGYAGSKDDVLDRYYQAAKIYKADVIVRITADCPLLDPRVSDSVIGFYTDHDFDYVSLAIKPTYPNGIETEVFSFNALEEAWRQARLASEREHVTAYIWKNPHIFKLKNIENSQDLSHMRWTVDEERDLKFVREVYKRLYREGKIFYMDDVLNLLKEEPNLESINSGIRRNEGYMKSLREDRQI